jgi:serine/threonine protein kinase
LTTAIIERKLLSINSLFDRLTRAYDRLSSASNVSAKNQRELADVKALLEKTDLYLVKLTEMYQHLQVNTAPRQPADMSRLVHVVTVNSQVRVNDTLLGKTRAMFPDSLSLTVSFVGPTHAGKSTTICHLLVPNSGAPLPMVSQGGFDSTTDGVHCFDASMMVKRDGGAMPSDPIRFLDVEGLFASRAPPGAVDRLVLGIESDALRRKLVQQLPSVCYMLSNVIVYVDDANPAVHSSYDNIKKFALEANCRVRSACPPSLVIVFNKCDSDSYYNVDEATVRYLDQHDSGRELLTMFQTVRCVCLPTSHKECDYVLYLEQLEKLKREIDLLLELQVALRSQYSSLYSRRKWCDIARLVVENIGNPEFSLTQHEVGQFSSMHDTTGLVHKALNYFNMIYHCSSNDIAQVTKYFNTCLSASIQVLAALVVIDENRLMRANMSATATITASPCIGGTANGGGGGSSSSSSNNNNDAVSASMQVPGARFARQYSGSVSYSGSIPQLRSYEPRSMMSLLQNSPLVGGRDASRNEWDAESSDMAQSHFDSGTDESGTDEDYDNLSTSATPNLMDYLVQLPNKFTRRSDTRGPNSKQVDFSTIEWYRSALANRGSHPSLHYTPPASPMNARLPPDAASKIQEARNTRHARLIRMLYDAIKNFAPCATPPVAHDIDNRPILCTQQCSGHSRFHRSGVDLWLPGAPAEQQQQNSRNSQGERRFKTVAMVLAKMKRQLESLFSKDMPFHTWPGEYVEPADLITLHEVVQVFNEQLTDMEILRADSLLFFQQLLQTGRRVIKHSPIFTDTCFVCHTNLCSSRLLWCGHPFCSLCVQHLQASHLQECPVCGCTFDHIVVFDILSRDENQIISHARVKKLLRQAYLAEARPLSRSNSATSASMSASSSSSSSLLSAMSSSATQQSSSALGALANGGNSSADDEYDDADAAFATISRTRTQGNHVGCATAAVNIISVLGRVPLRLREFVVTLATRGDVALRKRLLLDHPLGPFLASTCLANGAFFANGGSYDSNNQMFQMFAPWRHSIMYHHPTQNSVVVHYNVDLDGFLQMDRSNSCTLVPPYIMACSTSHHIVLLDEALRDVDPEFFGFASPPVVDNMHPFIGHPDKSLIQWLVDLEHDWHRIEHAPATVLSWTVLISRIIDRPPQSAMPLACIETIRHLLARFKLAFRTAEGTLYDQMVMAQRDIVEFISRQILVVLYNEMCVRSVSNSRAFRESSNGAFINPDMLNDMLSSLWKMLCEEALAALPSGPQGTYVKLAEDFKDAWHSYTSRWIGYMQFHLPIFQHPWDSEVRVAHFPTLAFFANLRMFRMDLFRPLLPHIIPKLFGPNHCSLCMSGTADGRGLDVSPICQHALCMDCSSALAEAESRIECNSEARTLPPAGKLVDQQGQLACKIFFCCPVCELLDPLRVGRYLKSNFSQDRTVPARIIEPILHLIQQAGDDIYTQIPFSDLRVETGGDGPLRKWLGKGELHGESVALKLVPLDTDEDRVAFRRQVALLSLLDHDKIVAIKGVSTTNDSVRDVALVITPYFPKTLFHVLYSNDTPLSWPLALRYLKDVAEGLHFLHNSYIAHRNIKPSNIVIRIRGNTSTAMITDMSFARPVAEAYNLSIIARTSPYAAPGMISKRL